MAVRTVGVAAGTIVGGHTGLTVTWNVLVTYVFQLTGLQFYSPATGRTYTLTLDGVTIATGTTVTTNPNTMTVPTAPITMAPGVHTFKMTYGGVAFLQQIQNVPSTVPLTEVFQPTATVESPALGFPMAYTIDSQQGTDVGVALVGSLPTEVVPVEPPPVSGLLWPPEELLVVSNFIQEDAIRDAIYVAEASPTGGDGGDYLPTSGRIFPLT